MSHGHCFELPAVASADENTEHISSPSRGNTVVLDTEDTRSICSNEGKVFYMLFHFIVV